MVKQEVRRIPDYTYLSPAIRRNWPQRPTLIIVHDSSGARQDVHRFWSLPAVLPSPNVFFGPKSAVGILS